MKRSSNRLTRWVLALGLGAVGSLGGSTWASAQQVDMGKPVSPAVQKANIAMVDRFNASYEIKDFDTAASLLADNIQRRVTQRGQWVMGKEAVSVTVKNSLGRGNIFRVLRSVSVGPVVLNERDDIFQPVAAVEATGTTPARPAVPLRAIRVHAGLFVVQDGKIIEWTDHRMTEPGAPAINPAAPPGTVDMGKMTTPEMQKANVAIVNDFLAAFKAKNLAKASSLLADNAIHRVTNTRPLADAIKGKDAVTAGIKALMDRGDVDLKIVPGSTVTMGPIVLHERDDLLPGANGAPGRRIRIHAGMFFVDDGKIVEWTDYRVE